MVHDVGSDSLCRHHGQTSVSPHRMEQEVKWSLTRTPDFNRAIRIIGCARIRGGPSGHTGALNTAPGFNHEVAVAKIDAKYGPGLNVWITEQARSFIAMTDIDILLYLANGVSFNTTVLDRLLSVRTEWSKK